MSVVLLLVEMSRFEGVDDRQPDGMKAGAAQSSAGAACCCRGWAGGPGLGFFRLNLCRRSRRSCAMRASWVCRVRGGSGCCWWVG